MESPVTAFVWRDVVGKRWVRCAVWQTVIASVTWLVWELVLKLSARRFGASEAPFFLSVVWAGIRFWLFQISQVFFFLGQTFISEPEESDAASIGDLASELGKLVLRVAVPRPQEETTPSYISKIRTRIRTKVDYVSFAILCVISGFLAFFSLLSTLLFADGPRSLDICLRGATLGLVYAALQSYRRKLSLSMPIIRRRLYFSFKMGVPPAFTTSCKLALALLPLGETVSQIFASERGGSGSIGRLDRRSFFWRQSSFAAGTFVVTFLWEVCHHLIQVLQTKHHGFAPPLGSPSAEINPTDLLLTILEDQETSSLVQYHAFLDLCIVSETNVDTWRRAAIFEETGDTYRRSITLCLKKLDDLTVSLAQGLEAYEVDKGLEVLRRQIDVPDTENRPLNFRFGNLTSYFKDFQICALCARTVASLTSSSRCEDRYGVAQLHSCNVAVVSSLLSCLLVVEVYLGRSSPSGVTFVPNSVRWTVPCRGAFMETGRRKFYPFGKRTVMHKKAYAMGDILRTCLYQIVHSFSEEMVLVGSGGKGYSIAVRDWLSQKKPLYGTHEMHLQKLSMFVPYQID